MKRLTGGAMLCGLVAGCAGGPGGGSSAGDGFVNVEVATVNMDPSMQSPVVVLRDPDTGQVLPIWVGLTEAQAIITALHGLRSPRPMTHDLLAVLVRELGGEVVEVQVRELRDDTFHGRVRLRVRGARRLRELDSRPSDAVALALRTGAPIRVRRELLREATGVDALEREGDAELMPGLGLTVASATPEFRQSFRLPERVGVVVTRVTGVAEAAGLRRGDLVVQVNNETPSEPRDLLRAVLATPEGDPVRLRYWRDGSDAEVELTPAEDASTRSRGRVREAGLADRPPHPGRSVRRSARPMFQLLSAWYRASPDSAQIAAGNRHAGSWPEPNRRATSGLITLPMAFLGRAVTHASRRGSL